MKLQIDRISTIGMFLTAMLSPCCFPLFGFALTALGLGSFELFGGWTMWVFQGLVLISLLGLILSYRIHRCTYPLLISFPAAVLIFYAYYLDETDHWTTLLYIGMLGLLASTLVNYYRMKLHRKNACSNIEGTPIQLQSVTTCPHCGYRKEETMPTDACLFFYECDNCKTRIKPKPGDCCVFCSYGTVACPPIQSGKVCC